MDCGLPAAGAGVEVQVDGIAGEIHAHKVADIDSELRRTGNLHVVGLYGKIEIAGFFQDILAEGLVGLSLAFHAMCNFRHIRLELQIVEIDGCEESAKS